MPRTPTTREDAPTAYRRLKHDVETMLDLIAADLVPGKRVSEVLTAQALEDLQQQVLA